MPGPCRLCTRELLIRISSNDCTQGWLWRVVWALPFCPSLFLALEVFELGMSAGQVPREEELRSWSVELPKAGPLAPLAHPLRWLPRDPKQGVSPCILAVCSGGCPAAQLWGHKATAYSHRPNLVAG